MQSTGVRRQADIDISKENRYAIFFVDLDQCGVSVKEDAEAVTAELGATGKRLFFMDTEGEWHEIRHDNGKFLGFKRTNAQERRELWHA